MIRIFHSIFFILLAYILYLIFNKKNKLYLPALAYLVVIYGVLLFIINLFFREFSNKLFLFLLLYSIGYVAIQFMQRKIHVFSRSPVLKENEKLMKLILIIRGIILNELIIALILIYQLLLIWDPIIFTSMIK